MGLCEWKDSWREEMPVARVGTTVGTECSSDAWISSNAPVNSLILRF